MLFSDLSFKVKFFSFIVPLVVLFLLTYGLLSLMDKHSDGIMKTTKYVLTNEEGMGFYDSPGGTEQMVMYMDDSAGAEVTSVEHKEGERWLDFEKAHVQKPQDGWAKIDIGDNGAPLYVEAQYVDKQTVRMFEGRSGESTFHNPVGTKNLPPVGIMFIMGCLLYFVMLYPWLMILKPASTTSNGKMWTEKQLSALTYAIAAYLILIAVLKFIIGYNVGLRWFTDCSMLLTILNVIVGLVGSVGLAIVLFRYYSDNVGIGDNTLTVFKNVGVKGVLLLVGGMYLVMIFLGVAVGVVLMLVGIYVFFKLLPVVMGSLAGGSGRSSKGASASGRAAHKCCSTCSRYNGTHCSDNSMQTILDPDSNCCSSYTRGI